jgi:ABC-2 type transport system ATP-binding protein
VNCFEVSGLTRRFGSKCALKNVNLELPPGQVLGLIGENGAGKTTLIKHVLGLLRPSEGQVRVFGMDPVAQPDQVLRRVGYLAEEDGLPGWMSVQELIRYSASFYPTWNHILAERLVKEFTLDPSAKLKTLSKGQRARAGLVAAMAFEPDLLVLDEPSSGLDPIVRRDILGAIIRSVADEGRAVLFSSHLLAEIERVADRVAMIREGEILFCDSLDAVKESHLRVTVRFGTDRPAPPEWDNAFQWEGRGAEWSALYRGDPARLEAVAAMVDARVVDSHCLTLDEIFVAHSCRVAE